MNKKVIEDRKKLVDKIIEDMEKGTPFFWKSGHNGSKFLPCNLVSDVKGEPQYYKGINNMILTLRSIEKNYQDNRWCTYKDAKKIGAQVRAKEEGTPIEYWDIKPRKEYNPETKEYEEVKFLNGNGEFVPVVDYYVRRYVVFNAEQMDNVPKKNLTSSISADDRNNAFENMISNSEAKVIYDQNNRNFYIPSTDEIHIMPRELFKDYGHFYGTAAHVIAHSTGHSSRLNRGFSKFGTPEYAKEELRAELASMFLYNEYGLDVDKEHMDNHKAYIREWIQLLEDDPNELFRAAGDAEKAADYIRKNMIELHHDREWTMESSMREWYMETFPDDEIGASISDISFRELSEELSSGGYLYAKMCDDSIVRERLFGKLSDISGNSYQEIYDTFIQGLGSHTMPKAGIWEINKKAFDSLKNSDEYDCSIYDLGTVYFGNDYFKLTGARKEDAVTIEYTHYMPLEKYNTVQFKEQDIQFNFLNLDEMSREFYIRSDSSQEYCKDININIFTKNNFEEAVCEMLYRDGKIFCNHYNEYVDIKERNSGFFQQLENQSNKVYKSLCKKEKLSYPELSALSNYYDKKLWNAYDKLDEQAIESGQNFILKEMVRDGLSDQRISIVGQKMESINEGFTPSWANDSIKDGEIKKIRAEINQTKNNIKTKQR